MASGRNMCLVCGEEAGTTPVSVHTNLPSKTGTVHTRMQEMLGQQCLLEACRWSQMVCTGCFGLLLNIVYLECRIVILKDKFSNTFEKGVELRKTSLNQVKLSSEDGKMCEEDINDSKTTPDTVSIKENMEDSSFFSEYFEEEKTLPIKFETISHDSSLDCSEALTSHLTFQAEQDFCALLPSHSLENSDTTQYKIKLPLSSTTLEGCGNVLKEDEKVIKDDDGIGSGVNPAGEESICVVAADLDDHSLPQETPVLHLTAGEDVVTQVTPPVDTKKVGLRCRRKAEKRKRVKLEAEDEDVDWKLKDESKIGRGGGEVQCELCDAVFSDTKKLGCHRGEAHPSAYPYFCPSCPHARYREKAKLTQHLRHTHHLTAHACPGCDHKAGSQNSLDQHIICHHPSSRFYECHICHKAFRTHRYLHFVHIKRCHWGLPVKYMCDKCNKGFVDKSSFENHKITHSIARNYACKFCGNAFRTPYALKVHINTHTQEKKYTCNDCGDIFLRLCNLSAHRKRFHSCSDDHLVCEVCGQATTTQRDLRRHQLATHAREKPFICNMCHKSYTTKEGLNTHLKTHAREKPIKCCCGKVFNKKDALQQHQRRVHEEEQPHHTPLIPEANKAPIQVGQEEVEGGQMLVITLRECDSQECDPLTVYSVQEASCLEEVLMASSTPSDSPHQEHAVIGSDEAGTLHLDGIGGRDHLTLLTPLSATTTTTPSLSHPVFSGSSTLTNLCETTPTTNSQLMPLSSLHTPLSSSTTTTVSIMSSLSLPSLT